MKPETERPVPHPYDRQPGEPARWFARFETYRSLGPARTLDQAFRLAAQQDGLTGQRPGAAWHRAAGQWNWQQRAETWDEERQQHLRLIDADRAIAAREQRLEMVDHLLQDTYHLLSSINLRHLSPDQALRRLPQIRLLFRDLLAAQRSEFGLLDLEPGTEIAPFTADELGRAQKELNKWRAANPPAPRHIDGCLFPNRDSALPSGSHSGSPLASPVNPDHET